MARIYLAHITVYDPALPGERVLRYCSGRGFVTGADAAKRPAGVAAHIAYTPRIKQPASMRRDCFSQGTTGGRGTVGYGELVLTNNDGALDGFLDYGLDGRRIEIIVGDMAPWQAPVFTTVLKGTMEQPRIGTDAVAIRIRDRMAEFDKPLQATKYAGTNALPAGLEGVAGDLQGQPKARAWGRVFNAPAPLVNSSRLIYESGPCASVDAVYDRGAALTQGANYTSQADMEANAPAAGTYRAWPAGGYFRLGASPAGQVTADVTQGAAAGNRTAAQLMNAIATGPAGIAAGDVSAADVAALDAANGAEVGLWAGEEMTCAEAMDRLANSVGAWWGFDRLGVLRMQRLAVPSGTPAVELTAAEIIRIDRVETNDAGRGVPAWRVSLGYKRVWLTQDSDLNGTVADARRGELRHEYRRVVAEDATVKTAHLLATELAFDTLLVDAAAAGTEATRLLELHKTRRDRFELRAAITPVMAAAIDLGAVVKVTYPRFGLASGRLLRVLGLQPNLRTDRIDLTLWG